MPLVTVFFVILLNTSLMLGNETGKSMVICVSRLLSILSSENSHR